MIMFYFNYNLIIMCYFNNNLIIMPHVEVLNLCFDFESQASAVLLLKFRAREAILSQAQSRNITDVVPESRTDLTLVEKVKK